MASAKGVRLEKSKLRGNLDIFTYGEFAVISSKDFWKLVDARDLFSPKLDHSSVEQVRVFTKATNLLIRMIKGEEKTKKIVETTEKFILKLLQENVVDLPADEAGKRLEISGNKINSYHFENSRLYGGNTDFWNGLDIGYK